MIRQLRRYLGAFVVDASRARRSIRENGWPAVRNRLGEYQECSDPYGVRVVSESTASIYLCDVFPTWGRRLLREALRSWEFSLNAEVEFSAEPTVSFIIPHRGTDRQALLETTIRSIASLSGQVECIVVEQDEHAQLVDLPGNTTHVHAPHPVENQSWHKCFAYNVGAQRARGKILVCHDGDILVPARYLDVIHDHLIRRQQEVLYSQRFLFYLQKSFTEQVVSRESLSGLPNAVPEMVKENWTGGSFAITKRAFEKIGGFDESFTGWTGEDREFYDRAHLLDGWFYGYVPFLHLWHPPQKGRVSPDLRKQAYDFTANKLARDRQERVDDLREQKKALN